MGRRQQALNMRCGGVLGRCLHFEQAIHGASCQAQSESSPSLTKHLCDVTGIRNELARRMIPLGRWFGHLYLPFCCRSISVAVCPVCMRSAVLYWNTALLSAPVGTGETRACALMHEGLRRYVGSSVNSWCAVWTWLSVAKPCVGGQRVDLIISNCMVWMLSVLCLIWPPSSEATLPGLTYLQKFNSSLNIMHTPVITKVKLKKKFVHTSATADQVYHMVCE
jgi:hypothetical protein